MNKKIYIIEILLCISIIITGFIIRSTYAKYEEETNAEYESEIKRWLIKVNNKDIKDTTSVSNVLQPSVLTDSNVKSNVIVPGSIFYIPITINYDETDVDFEVKYTIGSTNEGLTDFSVLGYKQGSATTDGSYLQIEDNPIIIRNSSGSSYTFCIYMKWNDSDDNSMNNLNDIEFYRQHKNFSYDVNLTFKQYTS